MRLENYAMDFEDMILFSLLHEISEGFYIDVGANDPSINSVTKFFYDRGWHGINIEPLHSRCKLLEEMRPRDVNLCVGVGSESGEQILYEISGLDILSSFSEEVAIENAKDMVRINPHLKDIPLTDLIKPRQTKILTLTEIFQSYCIPRQTVHFCKIDVENFEHEVLLGVKNWNEFRPWIFCIEAHKPTSKRPSYLSWEKILTDADYQFMFDYGVNRFYIDLRKRHLSKNRAQVREFLMQFDVLSVDYKALKITS